MAGRPAGGTTTGILVGLFVSIGIALVALVLLVVLWTKQEDLSIAARRARQEGERVMSPRERQGEFKAWFDAASGPKSVSKLMYEEMIAAADLLGGDPDNVVPGATAQLRTQQLQPLWDEITEDAIIDDPTDIVQQSTVEALQALYELHKDQHDSLMQAQSSVEDLNAERAQLAQSREELQKQFDTTVADLQARVQEVENQWASYRDEKQSVIDKSVEIGKDRAEEASAAAQELRDEINTLEDELTKKEAKNAELQEKMRDFQIVPQPRMVARQSDGHILRAAPGDESVFVDLGRNDHLTLGLTFAVYAPDSGIPSSGNAKAQIEVVSIGEEVSECRLKWVDPMDPVIQGDLVANPIYDRNRKLSFKVIGAYDLDYDGRDDSNGGGVIRAVISDMGGVIVEDLTSRTDFLIVGARPFVERIASSASAEEVAIQEDQRAAAEAYEMILEEATSLSVPMLTQETFLNFLGRRTRLLAEATTDS